MNPVVCVTEFTELTLEAARVAAVFARHWGERVVLVRSVDERGQFPFPLRSRLVQPDWHRLEAEARRLRQLGFDFEEEVLRGRPEDGIAEFAWRSGARLIVVGCTPTRPLERWALGCVAEEISATSQAPVLAVRSATAFERWVAGDRPLNVFAGFDPTARPDAVLNRLDELHAIGTCGITAGFVPYPEVNHAAPAPAPAEYRDHEFRAHCDFAEQVSSALAARHIVVRPVPAGTQAEAALITEASALQADLLVITTHPRTDLTLLPHRCLAQGVLRRAPMNVLCVPEGSLEPPRVPAARQNARTQVATPPAAPAGQALQSHPPR